ncbi:hypothetical protein BV911_15160 [Pseudoruegeria sp. SK021]|nr:hypothetical protein BV911_15160 [Pseudoruegeria sp. SK021]
MDDTADAFIETFTLPGAADGPLGGLTLAVKDLYDVAGHVTGFGSPDWAAQHPVPEVHAAVVDRFLAAGATVLGKTHTDELAYSLLGVNAHYGTPKNSADPRRVPGGSSSGSVAAVAAGLVDIGLGSDTGGSVRAPASFCGVWGLRTTHGLLPLTGARPLAPSFDTCGWFARDGAVMARVAEAMGLPAAEAPTQLLLPVDLWAQADAETVAALAPALADLEARMGPACPVVLAPDGIDRWCETFRITQAAEIWQTHGDWVQAAKPEFGPGVAERFAMAAALTEGQIADARAHRLEIRQRLAAVMTAETVLVLPTCPSPAPLCNMDAAALDAFRSRALRSLCPAGLGGLPQLSVPAGVVDGGPVGLSLIGAAGQDRALIALAAAT